MVVVASVLNVNAVVGCGVGDVGVGAGVGSVCVFVAVDEVVVSSA